MQKNFDFGAVVRRDGKLAKFDTEPRSHYFVKWSFGLPPPISGTLSYLRDARLCDTTLPVAIRLLFAGLCFAAR